VNFKTNYKIGDNYIPYSIGGHLPKDYDENGSYIIEYYISGGISGGSCWESSDPTPYTTNDTWETDILKDIILNCAPDIKLSEYWQLEKQFTVGDVEETEWYGNRTYYKIRFVKTEIIYNMLKEWGYIK